MLLPVLLLILLLREPTRTAVEVQPVTWRQSWRQFANYRRVVLPIVLAMAIAYTVVASGRIWAVSALSRLHSLPPKEIAGLMAVIILISGISGPLIGGLIADMTYRSGGPRRTLTALCLLSLLSIAGCLFTFPPTAFTGGALLLLLMVLSGCILLVGGTLLVNVVPNELRGISVATLGAAQLLVGVAIAPLVVSGISDHWRDGGALPYALTGVNIIACLFAAAAFLFARVVTPAAPESDRRLARSGA
jgi:MFS family permease